jgi:uncharacterized protein YyaL (SSP411 family)
VKEKKSNQLIEETSPYLLQHAYNPVEWYSWEKGIIKAKESQKPLLISIGYSSCHWCHVMEQESFEDPETASLMNKLFINIKIDREERPDLDSTYQSAVARVSGGRGGWPLTVFATPEGRTFAGGTYFPKTSSYGLPSFKQVISYIYDHYDKNPDQISQITNQTETALMDIYNFSPSEEMKKIDDAINITLGRLSKDYDSIFGGFGFQPKFPHITDLRFLLLAAHQMPEKSVILNMVINTLDHLAAGGIYDQLGFGFHRYSVDRKWMIPHFEKMLYDNAQLLLIYLEAYQATKIDRYSEIAKELIVYLEREMLSPEGMFYSSQDADSEGKEGTFFVWDQEEITEILGEEEGLVFSHYFGITSEGNFEEGKSVLHETKELRDAIKQGLTTRADLMKLKEKLFVHREKREKPFLNDNIITSWNAITIFGLVRASFVLQEEKYLELAEESMNNLLKTLVETKSGRLHRTYRGKVQGWAFSEDYILMVQACLELFGITGKKLYLEHSIKFQTILDEFFWDDLKFGYFFTSSLQTDSIVREKPVVTFSIPNANSVALDSLIRLYHYTGGQMYLERADKQARFILGWFNEHGILNGESLLALSLYKNKPTEVIVFEEKDLYPDDKIKDYLTSEYIPEILYLKLTRENFNELASIPLVQARLDKSDEYPFIEKTAYICKDLSCSVPLKNGTEIEIYLHHSKN